MLTVLSLRTQGCRLLSRVGSALLVLVLTGCTTTSDLAYEPPGRVYPPDQDLKLAAYNVGFGATIGGVGALINGDEGGPGRRFVRGAWRGALGGGIAHSGKWMAGQISASETLAFGLPALLVHDTGASIIENAAHDRPPFDRLSVLAGFVRLDVRPATGAVRARLMPVNTLAFALMLSDNRFSPGRTLLYGTPVFVGDGQGDDPLGIGGGPSDGLAFLNAVYLNTGNDAFHDTAAHELVHVMQHREYVRTAALYAPLDARLQRWRPYRATARWIYFDNPALRVALYFGVEGGSLGNPCYFDNWFEREAEAFGSRVPVGVCP